MALEQPDIADVADELYEAYNTKTPIPPLTDEVEITTEEAYAIQSRVFDMIREDSSQMVGHKLGLVSEAKQEQLGIEEPIFAPIVEETLLEGEPIPTNEMISPRIEAEIGFIIGEDIPAPVRTTDVITSTQAIVPVVEILESRFQGWSIPTAQDVIADLTSAGKVVIGESFRNVTDVDLKMESVAVSVNGDVEAAGVGADIMGHPARAVSWLGNRLEDVDDELQAGDLVMSGGITAAIDIEPGDVYNVKFANIGSIELQAE